jgi:TolB-like protein/class 3 adenylate cyclase/Flp pilus assembly protein TadD
MKADAGEKADEKVEIGHVLAIDVVGYSKLLIHDQTRVMAELTGVVQESTRFRVAQAAGKLISLPTGDGMILVFFGDPEAAMECALEISFDLKKKPKIRVRMGIHSGPVNRVADINQAQNVAGAGIDLAQRVMDCGDEGHILLSRRVAYDLAPLPRWSEHLYELGDCEIKHTQKISLVNFHNGQAGNPETPARVQRAIDQARALEKKAVRKRHLRLAAVFVFLLLIGSAAYLGVHRRFSRIGRPTSVITPPDKSIAVLPFVDLSQAKDQEYFCDGMSEEILGALAKTDGLRVVARTSSFSFKGRNLDASEIGRTLNVSTILEGTLRRDGNRIRIFAQLINARDGYELWSNTYEGEMQGVFALQDEITRKIVDALKIKMAVAPSRPPENTEAYELYLQGAFFSNKSSESEMRKSLEFFERALEKDPRMSRAWTGIAKDWTWLADAYVAPREAYPKVEKAARKAIALEESDAEAHAYLGEVKRIMMWDLKGEEAELNRALQIDPNSPEVHLFMGLLQLGLRNSPEASRQIDQAVRLDPLSPIIGTWQVYNFVMQRRLDEALAAAKRTMEIDPNYAYFEPALALVYREQGRLREALDIYVRVAQTSGQPSAGLAITYARLGKKAEARGVLSKLLDLAKTKYYAGDQIAAVYAALGDKEAAFQWLNRAIDEHSGGIHVMSASNEFDTLRSDPRFPQLLLRIGLDVPASP